MFFKENEKKDNRLLKWVHMVQTFWFNSNSATKYILFFFCEYQPCQIRLFVMKLNSFDR